jgi:imidazolonepropionase-like amidohydrolase
MWKQATGALVLLITASIIGAGGWTLVAASDDKNDVMTGPITAIVDAMIHTMEPGEKPFRGVLLLQGGKIKDVGERLAIPPGASVLNARGKIVTPGLVIPNTRLGLVEISMEGSTRNDRSLTRHTMRPAFQVKLGFNYMSSLIPVARMEGITAAMIRPVGGLISGQSSLIDLYAPYKKMFVRETLGIHATIRSGRSADSWMKLTRALREARFFLGNQSDYNMGSLRKLKLDREQLMALGRLVQRHIPLLLEVHRAADILKAIAFAQKEKIHLVLVGVSEGWMVAEQIAASNIPVILNPLSNLPRSFDRLGSRFDNPALLHKAGVVFAFGARGGAHNIRAMRQEAGIAVSYGLPKSAALKALTYNFYDMFHLTKQYGSIDKGKVANVVLWSGDPLELSTRAERVWIRGQVVPMVSRQTLLRERYRSLKGLYRQPRPPIKRPAARRKPVPKRVVPAPRRPSPVPARPSAKE